MLELKEANALIELAQWLVSFLVGIYFPVTVFPPLLRTVALLFPPTWMTNGVRASLLGVGWFFQTWYFDLAVLAAFCCIGPVLGYWVFLGMERRINLIHSYWSTSTTLSRAAQRAGTALPISPTNTATHAGTISATQSGRTSIAPCP